MESRSLSTSERRTIVETGRIIVEGHYSDIAVHVISDGLYLVVRRKIPRQSWLVLYLGATEKELE